MLSIELCQRQQVLEETEGEMYVVFIVPGMLMYFNSLTSSIKVGMAVVCQTVMEPGAHLMSCCFPLIEYEMGMRRR